ncbi:hypothetical protein [Bradyrhizobium sp. WSM471]|uniref:hypothetical protein n=1 Tax=Bradyrhizobium sp. WSM471 TaxID=319017 RepID=UPI00024D2D96|nr:MULTISPECIES: hypothetical protein [Bradyrhizobium]EHR03221.1 hypothetical protein Bra471DRAFT_03990 [Bradyrhizobium sp. WSM471]UFW38449.1 hypothetical protein BcanWSM471_19580 [Bradyrhizobium canariense]
MFSDDPRVNEAVETLCRDFGKPNPYAPGQTAPAPTLTEVIATVRREFGEQAALGIRLSVH